MIKTTSKKQNLMIMHWNCHSIKNKKQEFTHFLSENNIDVALLSETFLKPGKAFNIPNYITVRNDREKGYGGGTAIIIKNNIKFDIRQTEQMKNVEATSITVYSNENKPCNLSAVYKPPDNELLPSDLDKIFNSIHPTIIAGDLNCKSPIWGSRSHNLNGTILENYVDRENLNIEAPNEHTYFCLQYDTSDTLDLAITKKINWNINTWSVPALSSDHNPVLLKVNSIKTMLKSSVSFSTNWLKFQNHLNSKNIKNGQLKTPKDIENAIENLSYLIQDSLKEATINIKDETHSTQESSMTKSLLRNKNRLRKIWQKTKNSQDKSNLNYAQRTLNTHLEKVNNEKLANKLKNLSTTDGSLWKNLKFIKNTYSKIPQFSLKDGTHTTSAKEKAEILADTFADQFKPNPNTEISAPSHEYKSLIDRYTKFAARFPINLTSPKEVKQLIEKLANKKSSGPDNINNFVLKNLPMKYIVALTGVINAALNSSYFPSAWKTAIIIPIHKKGESPSNPASYRPISLLPSLGKLFEKIIRIHINSHLHQNKILKEYQFGFRSNLSCPHQLVTVTEHILQASNNFCATGVLFLDISKAFDKVWHEGLLYKLIQNKFSPAIVKIISSYLMDRKFAVKIEDTLSNLKNAEAGVPQGSVLGPTLFNLYINDLPEVEKTKLALYADDTAILSSSRSTALIFDRIQDASKKTESWCKKWRIIMNPKKTIAMMFPPNLKHKFKPPCIKLENGSSAEKKIKFFNEDINWKNETKYLGVTLDKNLTWRQHIKNRADIASGVSYQLNYILRSKNVSLKNKLIIYRQILRPMLTYACPAWITTKEQIFGKLEVTQNKILRKIFNGPLFISNQHIRNELKVPLLYDHMLRISTKFYENINKANNSTIKEAINYDPLIIQNKLRPRTVLAIQNELRSA